MLCLPLRGAHGHISIKEGSLRFFFYRAKRKNKTLVGSFQKMFPLSALFRFGSPDAPSLSQPRPSALSFVFTLFAALIFPRLQTAFNPEVSCFRGLVAFESFPVN